MAEIIYTAHVTVREKPPTFLGLFGTEAKAMNACFNEARRISNTPMSGLNFESIKDEQPLHCHEWVTHIGSRLSNETTDTVTYFDIRGYIVQ